ncbi:hypothetical protein DYI81_12575 [Acinetobacter sp. SWAC5]|uniref:hypothetical protein n=1 Tax=Acinetobacter sp. SWAC5 TaxID=2293835 RepID=UPI000E349D16|nr:hypothetical protein [Acinetobacter sp. SWAC5]RFS29456.1 hypothetical protein DYI81_12575 [Acinetobacter sp. SWAC5]
MKLNFFTLIFFMYLISIFFAIFDGVRGGLTQSYFPFSFLRDFFIILPAILIFLLKKIKLNREMIFFYIILIFIALYTFIISILFYPDHMYIQDMRGANTAKPLFYSYGEGIGRWMKFFSMLCLVYTANYLFQEKKDFSLNIILKAIVVFSLIYSLLTIVLFFFIPNLYEILGNKWYGRISIGYPTLDVCFLNLSLIILRYLDISKVYKAFCFIILVIAILFQNTTTGFALLFLTFLIYFYSSKYIFKILSLLVFSFIFGVLSYIYINYNDFDIVGELIYRKGNAIFFGNISDDPSYFIRMEQVNYMLKFLKSDPFYFLFGFGGIGSEATEVNIYSIMGFSGLIGLLGYLIISLYFLLKSFIYRNSILFFLILAYWIASMSLNPIYLYFLYFIYSLIIAYGFYVEKSFKMDKLNNV